MKKKKILISDVLHYAADRCLIHKGRHRRNTNKFSCCAVIGAYMIHNNGADKDFLLEDVIHGLTNMGCNRHSTSSFKEYGDPTYFDDTNESVQGMRYMWLKWAALMAEEQGV